MKVYSVGFGLMTKKGHQAHIWKKRNQKRLMPWNQETESHALQKILKSQLFKNYWRLMYQIWHTYFNNQEHGNISMSRSTDDLWPFLKITQIHISNNFCAEALGPIITVFHIQPPGFEEQKFVQMFLVCQPRWPSKKNPCETSSSEPRH